MTHWKAAPRKEFHIFLLLFHQSHSKAGSSCHSHAPCTTTFDSERVMWWWTSYIDGNRRRPILFPVTWRTLKRRSLCCILCRRQCVVCGSVLLGHCLQERRARLWPWWRLCEGSCRAETFSGPGWGKGCVAVRVWQRHKIKTQGILETWRHVAEPLADKEPADNVKHIEPSSGIRAHFLAQLSIQLCQVEKLSCGHMPANLPCRTNGK